MSPFEALSLAAVMVVLAAMPSSSVALVVAKTISCGRASGALSAAGIVAGDLVFVAMALAGMSVLAEQLGALFAFVKYCGGAYLVYLGISMIRSQYRLNVDAHGGRQSASLSDFVAGLALTLGDVKAILFYASLFPALVDLGGVDVPAIGIVIVVTVVSVGGVKLLYVLFASEVVQRLKDRVPSTAPQKIGGAVMIGCGTVLAAKA